MGTSCEDNREDQSWMWFHMRWDETEQSKCRRTEKGKIKIQRRNTFSVQVIYLQNLLPCMFYNQRNTRTLGRFQYSHTQHQHSTVELTTYPKLEKHKCDSVHYRAGKWLNSWSFRTAKHTEVFKATISMVKPGWVFRNAKGSPVCSDHRARQVFFISPPVSEHGVLEGWFGLEQFWHGSGCGISWAGGTSGVFVPPSCPRQGQLHQSLNPPWGQTLHLRATKASTTGKEVFFGFFLKLYPLFPVFYLLEVSENLLSRSAITLPLIFLSTCQEGVCRNPVNYSIVWQ